MRYIIIGTNQYLLYDPLKIAIGIADADELRKLRINGLVGLPETATTQALDGYLIYPGIDTARLRDIFNL